MEKQKDNVTSTKEEILCNKKEQNIDMEKFNSIGFLNEFCHKNKYKPPSYTTLTQSGPDHSPTFNIECQIADYKPDEKFIGSGLSIKEAKKNAAFKTIKELNLLTLNTENKSSFRVVKIIPYIEKEPHEDEGLLCMWNGNCKEIKIILRKKDGSVQKFKSFLLKIEESVDIDDI